jgi:hypothetical protein
MNIQWHNLSSMSKKIGDTEHNAKPHYGALPAPGLPVQVQCMGFKCMAFRDKEGRWVDLFTRKYLSGVLGVVPA